LQVPSEVEEERRLMYVGITRAEEKLYLISAKRRQTWGEYRYYNPSRFIEEIPHNLIESFESEGYSRGGSTFRSAVSVAKQASVSSNSDGYVKPSTGFGANFVAPQRRGLASSSSSSQKNSSYGYSKPTTNRTPQRTMIVKSAVNKKREEEKIAAFFKDNAIKRMADERRKKLEAEKLQAQEKEREREKNKFVDDVFAVGQRVFHEQMGIGHITDVMNVGDSVMYTIDFGKLGKKAMDASYAKLKKF
jgi:DNA helicase-2/ATP-dependent DNA helicase PcrA